MRLLEVAAEARRATFEVAARPASGELLEEVLDQVLLGELLDDLNLLDADGDLAGDGAAELDASAALRHEQADELPACDKRDREPRASTAASELGAELGEAERLARSSRLGIARVEIQLFAPGSSR